MSTGVMERFVSRRHKGENRRNERLNDLERFKAAQPVLDGPRLQGGLDPSDLSEVEKDELMDRVLNMDAIQFGEELLGVIWSEKQKELLELQDIYPKVAVAGCNSSGKTFTQAPVAIRDLIMHDEVSVMQISPTLNQSQEVFWNAMRSLYNRAPAVRGMLGDKEMLKSRIEIDDLRRCITLSPSDEYHIRGFHALFTRFVLDEGNGIDALFFEAMRGVGASGTIRTIQLGNPTSNSGVFYDCWDDPSLGWHTMNISAFDSPNLISLEVPEWFGDISDAPGPISDENRVKLAYLGWLYQQYLKKSKGRRPEEIEEYCILDYAPFPHLTRRMFVAEELFASAKPNNPTWFGRVLGIAPDYAENQLFSRTEVNNAREASEFVYGRGPMLFGCDPAGQGQNEWCLQGVQVDMENGMRHHLVVDEGYQGTTDLEQAIAGMKPYAEMGIIEWINIDRMGAGERPAVEITRWAGQYGIPVVPFVSQGTSTNPTQFYNMKAQAYAHLKDLFGVGMMQGISGDLMRRQLLTVHYDRTQRGQFQMETKEKMRKRGVSSPDRADGLAYACFPAVSIAPQHYWAGG